MPKKETHKKVSISIITYNQQHYIAQAIESALMQETDFDFEIVLGDDCSTDGTREICIKYAHQFPDIINLRLPEENLSFIRNMKENLIACKGKYIAILEGDDYWTDPSKLQKQVNYLDVNINCGLICTDYSTLNSEEGNFTLSGEVSKSEVLSENIDYTFDDLIEHNFIGSLTAVFRNENLDYNEILKDQYKTGDYALWLAIASQKTIRFMPDKTAVYRLYSDSLSHQLDANKALEFDSSMMDIKSNISKKYNKFEIIRNELIEYRRFQFNRAYELSHSPLCDQAYKELRELDPDFITMDRKIKHLIIRNKSFKRYYKKYKEFFFNR